MSGCIPMLGVEDGQASGLQRKGSHLCFFFFFTSFCLSYNKNRKPYMLTSVVTQTEKHTCSLIHTPVCAQLCACSVASVVSDSLQPCGLQPTRLLCPWHFPGKNTGMGCHGLLMGIFLTQEYNPHLLHLLHCRWILNPLNHLGSAKSPPASMRRQLLKPAHPHMLSACFLWKLSMTSLLFIYDHIFQMYSVYKRYEDFRTYDNSTQYLLFSLDKKQMAYLARIFKVIFNEGTIVIYRGLGRIKGTKNGESGTSLDQNTESHQPLT